MALTAQLEKVPSEKQILQLIRRKTYTQLNQKLLKTDAKDTQNVLKKVVEDVQNVQRKKQQSKLKIAKWREKQKDVTGNKDKAVTSNVTGQEKRREEKRREEENLVYRESRTFSPPSIDEVKKYLAEKNITNVNPEKFYSYYESNGWKVGRNKMKDWRAAITAWSAREGDEKRGSTRRYSSPVDRTVEAVQELADEYGW